MIKTASFWEFSVTSYRQPGVADACLSLQDRYGLDVNILLYACWFGSTRGPFDDDTFIAAMSYSEPWAAEVVRPLRAARTWMKSNGCTQVTIETNDCMTLRDKIKAVELEAEYLLQNTLEALTPPATTDSLGTKDRLVASVSNLQRYLSYCEIDLDDPSLEQLAKILIACSDGVENEAVLDIIKANIRET